jgi:Ser/Thr protein kinase RdoA (MazF antagonist)
MIARDRHVQCRHGIRRCIPIPALTPDVVLNALDGVGLRCDGTLLALNSYENRVYQVGIDDAPPLVAKFYRPSAGAMPPSSKNTPSPELPSAKSPSWRRWRWPARTLHAGGGFRFAVFPRRGGRAPELDRPDTLQWMGRFLGRIHAVGAVAPFPRTAGLDIASFGERSRDYLLRTRLPARRPAPCLAERGRAGAGRRAPLLCARRRGRAIRLHGDCHAGNVLWTDAVGRTFRRFRRLPHGARPCRTCGCCCPASAPR